MNKRMIALGLALASAIAVAQADDEQPQGAKAGGKGAPMARMKEQLGLTDEQAKEIQQIRQAGGSREEIQAVLTPEQQAKAKELKKGHKGKGVGRMKKHLGLSDEQAAQIKEIKKEGGSREDIRAVLTPEQQAKFDQARGKHKGQPPQSED